MSQKLFEQNSPTGKAFYDWWRGLEDDRGGRAELRRATTVTMVVLTPVFQRLYQRLRPLMEARNERGWEDRVAVMAGVAAHVRQHTDKSLPESMAQSSGGNPKVSELRFRRLIQRDREELLTALVRIVHQLDGTANLYDLADSVYYWGDNVHKRWAYAYYSPKPKEMSENDLKSNKSKE